MGSGSASAVPGTTMDGEAFTMYYGKDRVYGVYAHLFSAVVTHHEYNHTDITSPDVGHRVRSLGDPTRSHDLCHDMTSSPDIVMDGLLC